MAPAAGLRLVATMPMRLRLSTSRLTRSTLTLVVGIRAEKPLSSGAAVALSDCIESAPICQPPVRPSTRAPPMIGTTVPLSRPMRRL